MLKKNVTQFNSDVLKNQGFLYTTNAKFSSIVSNKRISTEVLKNISSQEKNIFDAGCGDGAYTQEIKNALLDSNITACDPSYKAIDIAQKKYPNINFFVENIENSSMKINKQDVTIVRGVLHHMANPILGLKNLFKYTNKIIIIEPNGNNPILKIIEKKSKYHIQHEEQSFTDKEIKKWLTDIGYVNIQMKYIGFVPFFFPTWIAKIIYFFQPFLEKIPYINKYFSAQIFITAQTNS